MFRRTAGVFLIIAAILLTAGAASALDYGTPSVGGSDTTPDPGQTITVSGTGCAPGSTVTILFDGQATGSTTADGSGNFSGSVTVPADATSGAHTITAQCGAVVLAFEITVNPTAVAAAPIPRTGSSSIIPMTSAGLALLSLGGVLVVSARRRYRHLPA